MDDPFAPPSEHAWRRVSPRLALMRRTELMVFGLPLVAGCAAACAVASVTAAVIVGALGAVSLVAG